VIVSGQIEQGADASRQRATIEMICTQAPARPLAHRQVTLGQLRRGAKQGLVAETIAIIPGHVDQQRDTAWTGRPLGMGQRIEDIVALPAEHQRKPTEGEPLGMPGRDEMIAAPIIDQQAGAEHGGGLRHALRLMAVCASWRSLPSVSHRIP